MVLYVQQCVRRVQEVNNQPAPTMMVKKACCSSVSGLTRFLMLVTHQKSNISPGRTSNLNNITQQASEALDERKQAGVIYIDLRKTFDHAQYHLLLQKLQQSGLQVLTLQPIRLTSAWTYNQWK